MSKKKKWSVAGTITAGTYVGTYEAETAEEAVELAWKDASVSVCHQCAHEISDPEVTDLVAEEIAE